jgi:Bacterial archaeo-eukaryotic release factor family 2
MAHAPATSHPLLRLGRLQLDSRLRALQAGSAAPDLVVTAAVPVPDSSGNPQYGFDVAWEDAVREAVGLGAEPSTAQALLRGSGNVLGHGTRVVVAAHGEALLGRWISPAIAGNSVRVGPLPHLTDVAAAAAMRPAYVVVLADRDGADVIAHPAGGQQPAERFQVGSRARPADRDHHDDLPPALHHGERHVTDSEPESGGRPNAESIAGRVAAAAARVGAHVVLGVGDQHILDAVNGHLAGSVGPISAIDGAREPSGLDDHLSPAIGAALDDIASAAVSAVGDLVASLAEGPNPAAVRGISAVAEQLAQQQVAVLLLAADISQDAVAGLGYRIGTRPTELLAGETDPGVEVPVEDGLVWAALQQDAIVVQLPDRAGALAGEPAAALLRRGQAS